MDMRLVLVIGVLLFGFGWVGPDGRVSTLLVALGAAFTLAAAVDLFRGRTRV